LDAIELYYYNSQSNEMEVATLSRLVRVHKALSHPARLRVLAMLGGGELCVCQIVEVLQLAPSTVSAHLRELQRAGLTSERKQGRWVHVRLAEESSVKALRRRALEQLAGDPQVTVDLDLVRQLRRLPVADLCRFGLEGARQRLAQTHQEAHP